MEGTKKVLLEGLEIHNQNILHSEKRAMGIRHWRFITGHMHFTTGTAMMTGIKWQLTHLYCITSTGEYSYAFLFLVQK
ncbi:hypothetical protein RchiOBHm_Chr1g0380811 [Rosa chinensis]|uniref:Uncharacterized protein n=1 Tax=Rosa chinensis TaxID=74649 RepID=A0A2P6SNZ4_ROSCH|nr:hypothetical protein RchiOBHm_Chr1g0380811 [Rosa chinensis]